MKKYEELMAQIKSTQPVIFDAERLTDNIKQKIEKVPQKKSKNKMLSIATWTSSIAASVLIGLFLFEQFMIPTNNNHQSSNIPEIYLSAGFNEKQTVLTDFNDWFRTKKEHQKKQQPFYSSIINHYKSL
jgi:hypothetical protein